MLIRYGQPLPSSGGCKGAQTVATRLDQLLDSINPRRTIEEVARRADEAINAFSVPTSKITDWDQFRRCVVRFLHHVEGHCLLSRTWRCVGVGMDFDWGRCTRILVESYGPNGEKAAFEMARTGNEGGLYAALKAIARSLVAQFAENEITAKVDHYWEALSAEERLAAGDEYLSKYGHLLPSELTEGSAARVRANLPKALREHPRMIKRLGRIGRT